MAKKGYLFVVLLVVVAAVLFGRLRRTGIYQVDRPKVLMEGSFGEHDSGGRLAEVGDRGDMPREALRLSLRSRPEAMGGNFQATVVVLDQTESGSPTRMKGGCRALLCEADGTNRPVYIEDGYWRGDLPDGAYQLRAVESEEALLDCDPVGELTRKTPVLNLIVRPAFAWTIDAYDTSTGEPLDDFSIHAANALGMDSVSAVLEDAGPGDESRLVVEHARSPYLVPESLVGTSYWVGAAGYEWNSIIRNSFQRRVRVGLTKTGSVLVRTQGLEPLGEALGCESMVVSLALPRGEIKEQTMLGQDLLLEHVPLGLRMVQVRAFSPLGNGLLLGEAEVDVLGSRVVECEVGPVLSRPINSELFAYVTLPVQGGNEIDWELELWTYEDGKWNWLSGQSLQSWEFLSGSSTLERQFSAIAEGTYAFKVQPAGLWVPFDLRPGESKDVFLELSDLATVNVNVSTAVSDGEWRLLIWSYQDEPDSGENYLELNSSNALIACSARPIWVQVIGESFVSKKTLVHPVSGRVTTHQVSLDQLPVALELSAWNGRGHANLDEAFWKMVRVSPVDHDGEFIVVQFGSLPQLTTLLEGTRYPDYSKAIFYVSSPGEYKFSFAGPVFPDDPFDTVSPLRELTFKLQPGLSHSALDVK